MDGARSRIQALVVARQPLAGDTTEFFAAGFSFLLSGHGKKDNATWLGRQENGDTGTAGTVFYDTHSHRGRNDEFHRCGILAEVLGQKPVMRDVHISWIPLSRELP